MKFQLTIACDTEAFEPSTTAEVARMLRALADFYDRGIIPTHVYDCNGVEVGTAKFHPTWRDFDTEAV